MHLFIKIFERYINNVCSLSFKHCNMISNNSLGIKNEELEIIHFIHSSLLRYYN